MLVRDAAQYIIVRFTFGILEPFFSSCQIRRSTVSQTSMNITAVRNVKTRDYHDCSMRLILVKNDVNVR